MGEQWAEEIRTKTTYGSLLYFLYNEETLLLLERKSACWKDGSSVVFSTWLLLEPCFRVVIATYDRLRSEFRNRQISGVSAPLIDMEWHRVILGKMVLWIDAGLYLSI